jgi:Uma2 family endonuclease
MSSPAAKLKVSFADYVAAEVKSDRKHQLVDGEVFDLPGSSFVHSKLILAVGAELRAQLRGRPCSVFGSETRVRAHDLVTYPDCVVVCGDPQTDPEDPYTLLNPVLLVEVLSESTEAFDRGHKAEQYRRIPSLREYVLVSQHKAHLECFRRTEAGWSFHEVGAGQHLRLDSIDCELDVESVYLGVLGQAQAS